MEEFVDSVENQTFPLHPVDTQSAFLNIPTQFFFPNKTDDADFMPSKVLKHGFYKALARFPIMAGHLQADGKGGTQVVVDRNNLNMPEYLESTSDIDYETMQKKNFHWSAWPEGLATVGGITTAHAKEGVIKLANVHITWMKNNSGVVVFLNVPHYVVDGVGFFEFVSLWGEMCRNGHSERQFCFDRSIIADSIPSERRPLNSATEQMYGGFSPLADWLAWLSPITRGWVLSKAQLSAGVSSSTFRVSRTKIDDLRAQVAAELPESERDKLTNAGVLAAVVSMMAAHAHRACDAERQPGLIASAVSSVWAALRSLVATREAESRPVLMLGDLRMGLALEKRNYTGNVLMPFNTPCPVAVLEAPITPESIATTARIVTAIYSSIDPPLIGSFVDMITRNPRCFTRPMMYVDANPKIVTIVNELHFNIYSADFGYGYPEWACAVPSFFANFIAIMPSPPPGDDIVVNIIMKTDVLDKIVANEFWQNIATLIY
ncbi:hypothetical protein GGI11_000280 [Coemansia sp. RSA 2049]|nr:hypothetical protein H4217_006710 [Coemansia sp. RSA 1939]KAJ2525150.1 hypothetical protein GGI11_000280 [Coemansia sp. RSA 2049]KAJ2616809.1 hypothetical protein EV177_000871 [Coemansia sp. RSA 1804]KAJ2692018.1 hypothetical protein GGH99_002009 [Coemansia sp. RSA 1285]